MIPIIRFPQGPPPISSTFHYVRDIIAAQVHHLRLGQTRDEVIQIMGQPASTDREWMHYGWTTQRMVDVVLPPRGLINVNARYSVSIRFDEQDRVERIRCAGEGLDLHR